MPLILAFPLLLVIVGAVVATFNFVATNIVAITSFVFVPLTVWFSYARRKHWAGKSVHALIVTLGSVVLAITAFQLYAWNKHRQQVADDARRAKIYAEQALIRKSQQADECRQGIVELKLGKRTSFMDLDFCAQYLTKGQTLDVCRPLIMKRALPQRGWTTCNALAEEARRNPQ